MLQDRLLKELALAGLTEMAAANRFLQEQFLPTFTAFVPWIETGLADILCVQEERIVAKDNTAHYQGRRLQIPQGPHRIHYVNVTVWVHEYPEEILAVFHGHRCLARYHEDGRLIESDRGSRGPRGPTHGSGEGVIVDSCSTGRKRISARG